MKSRFFKAYDVMVDVSEIVHVYTAATSTRVGDDWYGSVMYRNGVTVMVKGVEAEAIQQAVLDYEAAMQAAWEQPITAAPLSMHEVAMHSFDATGKTGAKGG